MQEVQHTGDQANPQRTSQTGTKILVPLLVRLPEMQSALHGRKCKGDNVMDPTEPLICEDVLPANLKQLSVMVCLQALKDLTGVGSGRKTLTKRLSAFAWLLGPGFEAWRDFADFPYSDPFEILPNLRQVKQLLLRKEKIT